MKTTIKATEDQIKDAIAAFNPFGYLDMGTAVNAALQAGENPEFVFDCVEEFANSCGMKIADCDPVYCVYDAILQHSRNEIEEHASYDFLNDFRGDTEINTHGNYMCTSYDYSDAAKEDLKRILKKKKIIISDLSEKTQWFLSQIYITQEDINPKKTKKSKK